MWELRSVYVRVNAHTTADLARTFAEKRSPRMVLVVARTGEAVFSSSRKMYESCCRGFASVRLMATEEFFLPLNLPSRIRSAFHMCIKEPQ